MNRLLAMVIALLLCGSLQAQDFRISKFKENMLDLSAARAAVKDRNGDVCAIIKFSTRDDKFAFEPNMGTVKTEKKVGETWLYVPAKTKRITVRHPKLGVLRDYVIPVSIEQKVVYEAELEITNQEYLNSLLEARTDTVVRVVKQDTIIYKDKVVYKERDFRVVLGGGFNAISIMGPTAFLGFNYKVHSLEAGVAIGLGKVKGISIYQADNAAFWGTYDYKPLRIFARYGYTLRANRRMSFTPQVGAAVTNVNGDEMRRSTSGLGLFSKTHVVSATVGCRFNYFLTKTLCLQLTPEYDIAVKKSKGYETIESLDSKIKSWGTGINLNVGLALYL